MAGDWIKMRADLLTSPKVVRMASALRADRLRVIGGLHAVWCLFDVHSDDGVLDGYSSETLDEIIGWPGFGGAMCAVEWLTQGVDFIGIPRFDEHNGQSAKRRAQEAQRKRIERAEASALDADKKRTREEKRREEKKTNTPARKRAAAARLVSVSELVADGVEQQAAEDWLTNRKAKDLPLTPTAWKQTKDEAVKAGLTPAQAVSVAAGNGWAGFKATWAADSAKQRVGHPPMSDKFAGAL